MSTPVRNRLLEIRQANKLSAAELARRVGVTRQTIYAIEDGNFVPNTAIALRLAHVLNVSVEEIFSLENKETMAPIRADLLTSEQNTRAGQLVQLCEVNNRMMAVPVSGVTLYLPAADGIIGTKSRSTVSINSPAELPKKGTRILLAGCDPAISLLNEMLRSSGIEVVGVPCSSRRALEWLKSGSVHAAGSHLLDHATGDYNVPIIRRLFPKRAVQVVTFAAWEQGLVVASGNPKSIHSVADLSRKGVTLMNREKGSGSRDLLDSLLSQANMDPKRVKGYEAIALGHLLAAQAVAAGTADCCIATRSAARCFGLDFIPLTVERFDLAFHKSSLDLHATKALLDLLNRSSFQNKLRAIAGYDTSHTGQLLM